MDFKEARTLVELAGLFMVLLPMLGMSIWAYKWRCDKKSKK